MEDLDLTALTAAEIAARVHDGRSSAVEIATAHVAKIAEREPTIGAFEEHDPERVLAEAAAVDKRSDRFALPLAGVPVAIKDNIDVAGYPTRHGSAATSAEPARRDDELVKRLRAAGAVVVGKTRMPELGIWGFTQSALGVTRNPLDEELDPGGSSGGSAAAVAAGMAALGLGTDGGGSVRVPAASCGLVGLAPTPGMVPLPGGADEHWCGMTTTGPLARTASDAALMFGVLRGDALDLDVPDLTKIALSLPRRLHPDHRAAAIGAAARLRAGPCGVAVHLADPPRRRGLSMQWTGRWHAGVAADVDAHGLALADLERATATMARVGGRVLRFHPPRPDFPEAWREQVVEWLDEHDHDLILGPALAWPPVRAGSMLGQGYWSIMLRTARRQPFARAWNLAGLPAVVAPVLVGSTPIGVQLVGRPGSEAALLAAALRLERKPVPAAASRSYT